jgi:hypothetical protein
MRSQSMMTPIDEALVLRWGLIEQNVSELVQRYPSCPQCGGMELQNYWRTCSNTFSSFAITKAAAYIDLSICNGLFWQAWHERCIGEV